MRLASIDLGTNTFNLLISDVNENDFTIVHKDKRAVKLGQGSINNSIINDEAWERAINALKEQKYQIDACKVDKIIAVATSAIRSASNGQAFVDEVKRMIDIDIQIIDGKREALYIYEGVINAVDFNNDTVLIMDIGGGSVEFIISDLNNILWYNSFELGIARIIEKFNPSDPISDIEKDLILSYLDNELNELWDACNKFKIDSLIGSSGSFDAIANMVSYMLCNKRVDLNSKSFLIPFSEFNLLSSLLYKSNYNQRKLIPGMDLIRLEMIVLGTLFINLIINKINPSKLLQSSYAIKEGIIFNYAKQIKK